MGVSREEHRQEEGKLSEDVREPVTRNSMGSDGKTREKGSNGKLVSGEKKQEENLCLHFTDKRTRPQKS